MGTSLCRCVQSTGVFDSTVHICDTITCRVCTCAHVCAVSSFALGDKGGGFQIVHAEHLSLGVGIILDRRRDRSVVLCLL